MPIDIIAYSCLGYKEKRKEKKEKREKRKEKKRKEKREKRKEKREKRKEKKNLYIICFATMNELRSQYSFIG